MQKKKTKQNKNKQTNKKQTLLSGNMGDEKNLYLGSCKEVFLLNLIGFFKEV